MRRFFETAGHRLWREGHPRRLGLFFLRGPLLVFVFLASLHAETLYNVPALPEADVTIRLATPWIQNPRFGFAPVRVAIENRARSERTWHVDFQAGLRNFSIGVLASSQDIAVPAGQTREVWIFVPVAEPGFTTGTLGTAFSPFGGGGGGPATNVKIADTPTGKKVTRTTTLGSGASFVLETDINSTTGTITTTNATPTSSATTSRSFPMPRGSVVTVTINQLNGFVSNRTQRNAGSTGPAVVNFVVTGSPPKGLGTSASSSGPVVTAPGPSSPMMLFAEVAGPGIAPGTRVNFPSSTSPNGMRPFAVSSTLEAPLRTKLSSLLSGAPNLSVVDPGQLPADWRVWSSFSGVVLTADEYAALDAGRRAALRGWVAFGGQLCLIPPNGSTVATEAVENLGAGTIVSLAEPLEETKAEPIVATPEPAEEAARLRAVADAVRARREARLGGLAPAGSAVKVRTTTDVVVIKHVQFFDGTAGLPNQTALALDKTGPLYEPVENENPNNTWLAMFLVAFAVVVGPLNLFLFAPADRRHRLFFTTPLIALAASIVLGVTILVQDGVGGTGARRALVVLLPGENQAAVFQEQAARTGFLARRNFPLADDIQLTSLPLDEPTWGGPETVFVRGRDAAGGDWFRSRARQAHLVQRLAATRSRVEQVGTAPDGAPTVQSSLGTTLRDFTLVGPDGRLWKIAGLPSGQRTTLEPGGTWMADKSGPQLPGGSARFKEVFEAAAAQAPGRWSAFGGATDLAPIATLGSIDWKNSEVIYLGSLEHAPETATVKSEEQP